MRWLRGKANRDGRLLQYEAENEYDHSSAPLIVSRRRTASKPRLVLHTRGPALVEAHRPTNHRSEPRRTRADEHAETAHEWTQGNSAATISEGTVTVLAVPKSPGFGTPVEDKPNRERCETSPREGSHRKEPVPRENVRTDANSRRTRTTRRDGESHDNTIQGGCAADHAECTRKRTLQYGTYHAETSISPFRHSFVARNQGERLRLDGQHEPRDRGLVPRTTPLGER